MNWFVLVAGILYVGASGKYAWDGQYKMAGVFLAYALANFLLGMIKEK